MPYVYRVDNGLCHSDIWNIRKPVGWNSMYGNADDTKLVQFLLNDYHLQNKTGLEPLVVDGIFGGLTYQALFVFQTKEQLMVRDGKVDVLQSHTGKIGHFASAIWWLQFCYVMSTTDDDVPLGDWATTIQMDLPDDIKLG